MLYGPLGSTQTPVENHWFRVYMDIDGVFVFIPFLLFICCFFYV